MKGGNTAYYASGFGHVTLLRGENAETAAKLFVAYSKTSTLELEKGGKNCWLVFEYDEFNENDIAQGLNAIKGLVTEGVFEFIGEDNDCWRYIFDNGAWYYEPGKTVYDRNERVIMEGEES